MGASPFLTGSLECASFPALRVTFMVASTKAAFLLASKVASVVAAFKIASSEAPSVVA